MKNKLTHAFVVPKTLMVLMLCLLSTMCFGQTDEVKFKTEWDVRNFLFSNKFVNPSGDVTLTFSMEYVAANGRPLTGAFIVEQITPSYAVISANCPLNGQKMTFKVYTDGTLLYIEGRETYYPQK